VYVANSDQIRTSENLKTKKLNVTSSLSNSSLSSIQSDSDDSEEKKPVKKDDKSKKKVEVKTAK
jgi:hypothetical protein